MKKSYLKSLALLVSIFAFFGAQAKADQPAGMTFSNFTITGSTISFDYSGVMPDTAPGAYPETWYLVNPDSAADPGFTIPTSFRQSLSQSSTGPALSNGIIGPYYTGDYVSFNFTSGFTAGATVSGHAEATWSGTVFVPSAISGLDVYWGAANELVITGGQYLGNSSGTPVPEPAVTAALLGAAALGFVLLRRKSRPALAV